MFNWLPQHIKDHKVKFSVGGLFTFISILYGLWTCYNWVDDNIVTPIASINDKLAIDKFYQIRKEDSLKKVRLEEQEELRKWRDGELHSSKFVDTVYTNPATKK